MPQWVVVGGRRVCLRRGASLSPHLFTVPLLPLIRPEEEESGRRSKEKERRRWGRKNKLQLPSDGGPIMGLTLSTRGRGQLLYMRPQKKAGRTRHVWQNKPIGQKCTLL